jgi:transitional endoplasmic reticulum ATPase
MSSLSATVDHLTSLPGAGPQLLVKLDQVLMRQHSLKHDDLVRIRTERGRSLIARLDSKGNEGGLGASTIRLDRFSRRALKAHLNEAVTIEPVELKPIKRVELTPAVDVSTAHNLVPHIKRILIESRTPLGLGAILYIPFQNTHAGTTYEVHKLPDGAGYVDESTELTLHYHDAHLPDGAYDVTFEDIGGMNLQIKLVRELVQLPLKFPHVYRHLGINPSRGIILYGPPGSGKTHLARAIANEIDAHLFYINGPEIIGTYTGETEGNLRRIFNEAGHHAPSVVFIDELDALAPKRGETGAHADTRAVTQLLSLMDGLNRVDSVVVLATTNRVDSIDAAFRRPGRFDREIFVGPPDTAGRREILGIHTREMPLTEAALKYIDDVARSTHGFVGADLMELCRDAGLNALRRSTSNLKDHRTAFKIDYENLEVDQRDFAAALTHVRPSALRETLIGRPDVGWNDIGGLHDVKKQLRELVEYPLKNPEILASAGVTTQAGILLYGPPGTGKTLLAKAIAKESGVNFIAVDGPELFTKWLGESEEGIRHVFQIARQVAPTVIFFDQLDAIAPVRGAHSGSMTTERVVNQLLAELDGIQQLAKVVVVAATNRRDLVDPSVLRPGRFGVHIHVPLPDEEARKEILRRHLGEAAFKSPQDLEQAIKALASQTMGFSGAGLWHLSQETKRNAIKHSDGGVTAVLELSHALSALERQLNNDKAEGVHQ